MTLPLAIDEIENSLSINNVKTLMKVITSKFPQTFIATHSRDVVGNHADFGFWPIRHSIAVEDVGELLEELHSSENKVLLVEGKHDIPWFKKALSLLDLQEDLLLFPGGGGDNNSNIILLKDELDKRGFECLMLVDGDKRHDLPEKSSCQALNKECVELYCDDLDWFNNVFNLSLDEMPDSTEEFNDIITNHSEVKMSTAKEKLSEWADQELTCDHEFVRELNKIITSYFGVDTLTALRAAR